MKVNVVKREKNQLLKREDIEFEILDAAVTPSRKEIADKISALTNAKPGTVVVEKIETMFGTQKVKGLARVYEEAETAEKTEPGYLMKRGKKEKKEEEKKEEKPVEAGKPEEKKEEAPAAEVEGKEEKK